MNKLLILISVVCFTNINAQISVKTQLKCDDECVSDVRSLITLSKTGYSPSWWEKVAYRLGDKVGLAIIAIYEEEDLSKPENLKIYLPVIEDAFAVPRLISDEDAKRPEKTLELLAEVKARIHDTKTRNRVERVIKELKKL